MSSYTIVGVIGHIDHGKTSLVAALTGIDTDTHPEEKRRGITIDLGFASFTQDDHQFALIDAPGHQKYIGNLLAGVSRIDVGLLVVACDQGIQEQTLEHASVLQMLGVKRLIVAISRIDLANDSMCRQLQEDLEVFLDDYGFTDVPMIPVSTVTQTGIEELKSVLCEYADSTECRPAGQYFRMPVDRVFTLAGRGCVVAGTIWSGQVSAGDNVELASSSTPVRVREIEAHGLSVFTSKTGHRTALNLTGISANDVQRGDELIQPGVFPRSRHILAEVRVLAGKPEIKCPATLHLHSGTASCAARITGIKKLLPSTSAIVVMETNSPLISTFGQFGLLRLPYPIGTFGGVRMLASLDLQARRTRKLIEFGEKLAIGNAEERLIAWVEFSGELEPTAAWSELQLGIPAAQQETVLQQALNSEKIHRIPHSPRIVAAETLRRLKQHVVDLLARRAEDTHDAWSVEESVVRQAAGFGSSELIRWAIGNLLDDGTIVRLGNMLAIASDENSLSKRQLARMNEIANLFEDNRSPPSTKEIAAQLQLSEDIVVSLTRFAVQAGILIDTGNGLLVSSQVFQKFCNELNELFSDNPQRSVAEIKDRWQVTRKHAIPFLEYCDRMQITRRKENLRTAGPVLGEFIG